MDLPGIHRGRACCIRTSAVRTSSFYETSLHQWTDAGDLRAGDVLDTGSGGRSTVLSAHPYVATMRTYNLSVEGVHTFFVLAGNTPVLVHNDSCPKRLSDPLPNGLPKSFVNAYDDIRAGNRIPQIDPRTNKQAVFQGRDDHTSQWAGALEFRVPGAKNEGKARILHKTLGDGRVVMGWTTDHYKTIKPFTAPHFPDHGWK